jgi:sec-independent protein translocase protein TatB
MAFSEIIFIVLIALLVLGPERLPKLARDIGHFVGRARAMARQFTEQLEHEVRLEELAREQRQQPAATTPTIHATQTPNAVTTPTPPSMPTVTPATGSYAVAGESAQTLPQATTVSSPPVPPVASVQPLAANTPPPSHP